MFVAHLQHPDYDDGSGGFVPHDVCVLSPVGSISGTGVDLDSSQSGSDCWISGWGVDTSKTSHSFLVSASPRHSLYIAVLCCFLL